MPYFLSGDITNTRVLWTIVMAKTKIAICIPNMILGGVESVFCRTLDELLNVPDLEIVVLTHAKITEPLYLDWFKAHPETCVRTYYPLQHVFERLKEYTIAIFS